MLNDPRTTDDIKKIAENFDIKVDQNVVIEQVQRLFAGPTLGAQPIVQDYNTSNPITQTFNRNNPTIFNIASTVSTDKKDSDSEKYFELLKTSQTSWAEYDLGALFDVNNPIAQKDDKDTAGPVSLAVAYEKKHPAASDKKDNSDEAKFEEYTRVVVFGDSDWIMNANIDIYSNRDLILNALNWAVGEDGGIAIRPKTMRASAAEITRDMFMTMLRSSLIIPELILVLGLFIWWRRREAVA